MYPCGSSWYANFLTVLTSLLVPSRARSGAIVLSTVSRSSTESQAVSRATSRTQVPQRTSRHGVRRSKDAGSSEARGILAWPR